MTAAAAAAAAALVRWWRAVHPVWWHLVEAWRGPLVHLRGVPWVLVW